MVLTMFILGTLKRPALLETNELMFLDVLKPVRFMWWRIQRTWAFCLIHWLFLVENCGLLIHWLFVGMLGMEHWLVYICFRAVGLQVRGRAEYQASRGHCKKGPGAGTRLSAVSSPCEV